MKKTIFTLLVGCALTGLSQENNTWRLGVQWGVQGNHSQFSGGMSDAHARFQQNPFGGGAIDFVGRYDFNNHWMIMSGLGLNSFGFEFALSENYSLLSKKPHQSVIRNEFGSVEIPLMAFYKFDPNCKNVKWIIGGGFANAFVGSQTVNSVYTNGQENSPNSRYLNSTASSVGGNYAMIRFSVGRERVFKRGSILNASMIFNAGLNGPMAKATVNYTIDNQQYSHEFSNSGNFVGFRLSYFFKPLKSNNSSN